MAENLKHATRALMEITNAPRQFEKMVAAMLTQVKTALGVPQGGVEPDPVMEAEFARLTQVLRSFYPEYEQLFHEMFVKHLGPEHLAAVLEALSSPGARSYFQAVGRMESELTQRLTALMQKMGQTPLQAA